MNCGAHADNDLWWVNTSNDSETKKCSTSLSATSTINYQNLAEYKCTATVAALTGNTNKVILSETACPPLTLAGTDDEGTLAYEDLPGNVDSDYNDFVTAFKVTETYNSLEQLTQIQIMYRARYKLAGSPSSLILVFDGNVRGRDAFVSNLSSFVTTPMFEGAAKIKMETFDNLGNLTSTANNLPKNADLKIYADTKVASDNHVKVLITISNLDPALNTLTLRGPMSIKRYRTMLYVDSTYGTQYDVDLSEINPGMFDALNSPLGFYAPVGFKPMQDLININVCYPKFADHAAYLFSGQPAAAEPASSRLWFNTLQNPQFLAPPD